MVERKTGKGSRGVREGVGSLVKGRGTPCVLGGMHTVQAAVQLNGESAVTRRAFTTLGKVRLLKRIR